MNDITYAIVSFNPFTVVYQHNKLGRQKTVVYDVPLLNSEIQAEIPYIVFDEPTMHVQSYGDELLLMDGQSIVTHLPH